jgi:hypothetical protein
MAEMASEEIETIVLLDRDGKEIGRMAVTAWDSIHVRLMEAADTLSLTVTGPARRREFGSD